MDETWKKELLKASRRLDSDQVDEFLNLINQASGKCSLDVARVFMKTFSDQPDYGTQERVISVLSTADDNKQSLKSFQGYIKRPPSGQNLL